jgi:anti-sigma regulatory factor (Ser/Thr protein kinase)
MEPVERLSVPGTPSGVRQAIDAFERFGQRVQMPRPARWRVQLALDEILSNIALHGAGPGAVDPAIDVTFSFTGGVVGVEIVDTAAAFNPLLVPAPDTVSPLADRPEGGLGIALVRYLVDEASYERRGDRNHFVMRCRANGDS